MTSTTPTQAVAVLGLPDVAQALAALGYRVVTGETFRSAAAAVNAQVKVAPIPLIMADVAVAGTVPWVEKVLRVCPAVMVGVDLGADETRIAGNTSQAHRLPAPASLDAVLAAVGLTSPGTTSTVGVDGTVSAARAAFDDADDWGLDELEVTLAAPPPPPPALPAATQVPAAAVVPPRDFWGPAPAVAPAADLQQTVSFGAHAAPETTAVPQPQLPPADLVVAPPAAEVRPAPVVMAEQIGVETSSYSPTLGRNLAPVVFTLAGKGGVGKTSLALALAQRAAVVGQMRVVLIDANRGQGDLRIYLSLGSARLPTVLDAVTEGDPAKAIVTPEVLNLNRPAGAEQLGIALVQAPPNGMADPEIITAALYYDVITAARGMADLVVIDTQIVEGAERGLFDELIIPMLYAHAYGLGIADLSKPGVDNLVTHMREFIAQGVPVSRLMTMLNRVPETTEFNLQKTSDALSQYGQFLASVPADAELHSAMAYGTSIQDNPALSPVLDSALLRVTGNPVFTPAPVLVAAGAKKRGGFFRRGRS